MAAAKIKINADLFRLPLGHALLEQFGGVGIAFYLYLLCALRNEGYYLKADGDFVFIAAADLQVSVNKVDQMLGVLFSREVFDAEMYRRYRVLTSEEIQREYRQRTKKNEMSPIWMIAEEPPRKEPEVTLPESFSPALYAKVLDWLAYKREQNGKGYTPTGLKTLLGEIERRRMLHGDQTICQLIALCMERNWQGIIWEKLEQQQPKQSASARTGGSSIDKAELMQAIRAQFK